MSDGLSQTFPAHPYGYRLRPFDGAMLEMPWF